MTSSDARSALMRDLRLSYASKIMATPTSQRTGAPIVLGSGICFISFPMARAMD